MSHTETGQTNAKPASTRSPWRAWLPTILMNIVLPSITYFALVRGVHLSPVSALLLSGIWPLIELMLTVKRQRHVDEFGLFVLIGIGVGVLTTVFSDSARALFLKESISSGLIGLIFLVTLLFGRPLTFYLGRRFATDGSKLQRDWWNGLWQYPAFRRVQRQLGAAWGVALLGEASIRAFLTLRLGASAMVLANNVVPYVVLAVMISVSVAVGRRAKATATRNGAKTATPPTAAPAPFPCDL